VEAGLISTRLFHYPQSLMESPCTCGSYSAISSLTSPGRSGNTLHAVKSPEVACSLIAPKFGVRKSGLRNYLTKLLTISRRRRQSFGMKIYTSSLCIVNLMRQLRASYRMPAPTCCLQNPPDFNLFLATGLVPSHASSTTQRDWQIHPY
jgi:hypothetical protein